MFIIIWVYISFFNVNWYEIVFHIVNSIKCNKAILNNAYKKANELQPTMMVVNFIRHSEDGDFVNTAIIGIKAKIYPVSSSDICSRISGKLGDKNVLKLYSDDSYTTL